MAIPVIDIFAGPGGLGEGFCSLINNEKKRAFKIVLSIEKDKFAHTTLKLRSFFRQFDPSCAPEEYYDFLKGKITLDDLYQKYSIEASEAEKEAWQATLGESENAVENKDVDKRIIKALKGEINWLLIGGPPCQAYSVVGRSRRQEKVLDEKTDERVGLYKQYLRILAVHNPAVFVMENVKGLLSAETKESPVFSKILDDLTNPVAAYISEYGIKADQLKCPGYKIYSLAVQATEFTENGWPKYDQKDFVIRAEKYGIPQTRHRVILLGVRSDINIKPESLLEIDEIGINKVLTDLPRLRSGLSKQKDGNEEWKNAIYRIKKRGILNGLSQKVKEKIYNYIDNINIPQNGTGSEFISQHNIEIQYRPDWFLDKRLGGICNHKSRSHMETDLQRYFFVSSYGKLNHTSPKLENFPIALLPKHENVTEGIEEKKFADRFRVQLANKPSKTITSHISKDGHYYIHFDPTQCRSLSVREAARIQTFPDNYYFCGPRTAQFAQVGNAVPPLLANNISKIVYPIFEAIKRIKK